MYCGGFAILSVPVGAVFSYSLPFALGFSSSQRSLTPQDALQRRLRALGGVVISPMVSDAILRHFSRKSEIKRSWAKKREQAKPAPAVSYLRHKHGVYFLYGAAVDLRHRPDFLPCLTGFI